MSLEQPEARPGRAAVFILVAAIFIATALAIALVAGAASKSGSSGDVLVLGARVTHDTSVRGRGARSDETTTTSRRARAGSRVGSTTSTTAPDPTATTTNPPSSAGRVEGAPSTPASAPADPEGRNEDPVESPVGEPPAGPGLAVATISAAEIRLDAPVYEGLSASVLDAGPGHWPGTAAPGGFGNLVIAGHRTTSSHPFERIGELEPGDPIVVSDVTGSYAYVVEGSTVVPAGRIDMAKQDPGYALTLIAAHPPGSEKYRYVVRARLVSAPRPPGV